MKIQVDIEGQHTGLEIELEDERTHETREAEVESAASLLRLIADSLVLDADIKVDPEADAAGLMPFVLDRGEVRSFTTAEGPSTTT